MDEGHLWSLLRDGLQVECGQSTELALQSEERDVVALDVVCIDGTFFPTCEDRDDTAKVGCFADEGEEVDDEAETGVVDEGVGSMKALGGGYRGWTE